MQSPIPLGSNPSLPAPTTPGNPQNLLVSGSLGYLPGIGDSVVQQTNKSTAVATASLRGSITTNNANLATGGPGVIFAVNNPNILAGDIPLIAHVSGGTAGAYDVAPCLVVAGVGFSIRIRNESGGALAEALVLSYAILRA